MQKDFIYFHFYIICYIHYDNVKLETCYILAVDDLCTSTGIQTTILSCATLDAFCSFSGNWNFFHEENYMKSAMLMNNISWIE